MKCSLQPLLHLWFNLEQSKISIMAQRDNCDRQSLVLNKGRHNFHDWRICDNMGVGQQQALFLDMFTVDGEKKPSANGLASHRPLYMSSNDTNNFWQIRHFFDLYFILYILNYCSGGGHVLLKHTTLRALLG